MVDEFDAAAPVEGINPVPAFDTGDELVVGSIFGDRPASESQAEGFHATDLLPVIPKAGEFRAGVLSRFDDPESKNQGQDHTACFGWDDQDQQDDPETGQTR